jgi:NADH:ubiquinone oxidoreductase subunit 5 (chain L)/Multisubunit Na+/H+ antiporter, MnhA subunit
VVGVDLVPLLLLASSTAALLVGRYSRRACELLAVAASGSAAALTLYLVLRGSGSAGLLPVLADSLSGFMLAVVCVLGFLIVVYSVGYMAGEDGFARYYFFILLFIGAMSGLVVSADIVLLYLFWELVGVCSAMLISFWWEKPEARRAGLKAFTVTRIGDIGFLAALALVVHSVGTTSIPGIIQALSTDSSLAGLIGALLLLAAAGKSAQFPLLVWLPDAMEGPTSVSALIHAATMVKAGVYLLSRFYPTLTVEVRELLFWLALATAFMSAVSALASYDLKRVLAFSTVNHLALMFLALAAGAWAAAQLHLLSHSLFKALLFLCAGLITHEVGTRNLDEISGLWKAGLRLTGAAFLIGALSLAGVPPFPGFFTKEAVLEAVAEHLMKPVGEVVVLLMSFLSSAYIFRLFLRVFAGEPQRECEEHNLWMLVPIAALAVATLAGALLLLPAAELFATHLEAKLDVWAVLGLVAGAALAYAVWGGFAGWLTRGAEAPGRIRGQGVLAG